MRKTKKIKNSKKLKKIKIKTKPSKDLALEEHIIRLLEEQNKKAIKESIDSVVKKEEKKKEVKEKKKPTKAKSKKSIYGRLGKADKEYHSLREASIYSQITINPFVGFVYKPNIKDNKEVYEHLQYESALESHQFDKLGDKNLASSKMMDEYGMKVTLNFLTGSVMMTDGMNQISVEEKELMFFNLYDRTQNLLYVAKLKIMGFGDQGQAYGTKFATTLKTMHAPMQEKKAA